MSTLTPNYKLEKPEITDYYDVNVQNRNWEKIDSELKNIDDKKADLGDDGKILSEQLPPMNYDPAGSAAAVQKNLDAHTSNKKNPHGVTADQVGADPEGSANAVKQSLEAHTGNKQNPHGVTAAQVGAYSKEQALSSATAALFGLGTDAVPDDALRLLGRFNSGLGNEYLWHKIKQTETVEEYSEGDTSGTLRTSTTHYYADSVEYDETKPYKAALKNPQKYTYSMNTVDSLVGKYITNGDPSISTPYKITEITAKYSSSANWSGEISALKKSISIEDFGFLNSPDSDAYPPSEFDGYDYVSMGKLGDKARIVTGSYIGNGEYGEDKPTKLVFDSEVKALFILPVYKYGITTRANNPVAFYAKGSPVIANGAGSSADAGFAFVTVSGGEISWYSTRSVDDQLNAINDTYYYLAIL